jgi:hypothetical protein
MTAEPAKLQIPGRARFLLFVMAFVAPVMAAGTAAAASFTTLFDFPGGNNESLPFTPRTARSTA